MCCGVVCVCAALGAEDGEGAYLGADTRAVQWCPPAMTSDTEQAEGGVV
jgi:hypothetical protein